MEEFVGIGQLQIKQPGAHESDPRGYNQVWSNGLTKREWIAAIAFQGLIALPEHYNIQEAVKVAIKAADALIEELKK